MNRTTKKLLAALEQGILDEVVLKIKTSDGEIDNAKLAEFLRFALEQGLAIAEERIAYVVTKAEQREAVIYNRALDDAAVVLKLDAPDDIAPLGRLKRQVTEVKSKNPFLVIERDGKWWNS